MNTQELLIDAVSEKQMALSEIERLEHEADYEALIKAVKEAIKQDSTVLSNPAVKRWCGMRWRNLFLNEAVQDTVALKKADKSKLLGRKDKRPAKQKIAERYLRGDELREWSYEMPAFQKPKKALKTSLIFSPGLLNGMLPVRAFQTALPKIEADLGIRVIRADNHPMRGCQENVEDLVAAIEKGIGLSASAQEIPEVARKPVKDFILIGYSKGAPDIYHLLVSRPDLIPRIRCIFNWGGAIGGSYLANDIYQSLKDMDIPRAEKALANVLSIVSPAINLKSGTFRRIDEYNIKQALHDLTTDARDAFFKENKAFFENLKIPVFNITGSTSVTEVPYFSMQGVMEVNRYDSNNDMQLTQAQAKLPVPMATDLAMLRAHHWDMSYDPFPRLMRFGSPNLDHPFPKEAAMKAMIMLGIELGLIN